MMKVTVGGRNCGRREQFIRGNGMRKEQYEEGTVEEGQYEAGQYEKGQYEEGTVG